MPRLLVYLVGPEFYWIIVCVLTRLATRRSVAPDPAITHWLDDHWLWLPLVFTPLTFAFFFVAGTSRWWMLLRIDLAIAVALVFATTTFCHGLTYHQPSAGPGAGTAFMGILAMGYCATFVGTAIVAIVIWLRGRGQA